MANYYIGTQVNFDALPLLPTIDTTNGGIMLNSAITMNAGYSITLDSVKFKESSYATTRALTNGSDPAIASGFIVYIGGSTTTITSADATPSNTAVPLSMTKLSWVTTASAQELLYIHRHRDGAMSRAISSAVTVKDAGGSVLWQWLNSVSDYKSTPPNATVSGTLVWGKLGIEANYTSVSAFTTAVTAPTEPVVVYVSNLSDGSGVPSVINGQPVTVKLFGANRVLLGSITSYYAWRGALPYLNFDGIDDYANLGNINNFGSSAFYVEFSVPSKPTGGRVILSKSSGGDNKNSYVIYYKLSTDQLALESSSDGIAKVTQYSLPLGSILPTDVFRVVKNGTSAIWYKNGVSINDTAQAVPASLFSSTVPCFIGAQYTNFTTLTIGNYTGMQLYYLDINGTKYINQGDQNGNNILPSTPASASPYLNFGGVANSRAVLPSNVSLSTGDVVKIEYYHVTNASVQFLLDSIGATTTRAIIQVVAGQNQLSNAGSVVELSLDGSTYSPAVNVVSGWNTVYMRATASCLIGNFGSRGGTYASPLFGGIGKIELPNGYSYITPGSQNTQNILRSYPAGADGTIVGATWDNYGTISGAGWKYVGISAHYETVALLNSYISSTTLTEPLEVVMLEPLDTSTVPTSKDGQPIILTRAFGGIVTDKLSFGFRFGF